ncbi:hypothetical protein BBJ28_00003024 [Nothophytophthora sp. Chile5]|nr:hypothetical protein BBJ28_00003024 [Nothophytophthora sp. Chile5]
MLRHATRLLLLGVGWITAASAGDPWGYRETTSEELGPSDWKNSYPSCGGSHQSPVDIPVRELSHDNWGMPYAPLKFSGDCERFTMRTLEDLYKWEINGDENCNVKSINFDGRAYSLAQFHLHSTSEHTFDGYHYDGELHFVHKEVGGSGNLLVTSLLLNAQPIEMENGFIGNLWNAMNTGDAAVNLEQIGMNYADMLNGLVAKSHLFNYNGSLTTPPCSEIVDWWVLNNPISITYDELEMMKSLYAQRPSANNSSDNRPTQPLNDREIMYY